MDTIQEIAQEAKELSQKKSWIKKGLADFLDQISNVPEIAKIESDFAITVELDDMLIDGGHAWFALQFETHKDAYFHIVKTWPTPIGSTNEETDIEPVVLDNLSSDTCREIAMKIPNALESIADGIKIGNSQYESAVEILHSLTESVEEISE